MLAHNIKEILNILPEAKSLVKKANLEEDFPTDCKDSVCASYLRAKYLIKVAHRVLDMDLLDSLDKAAAVYGVKNELDNMSTRFSLIEKFAEETELPVEVAEAGFEGDLSGFSFLTLEKTAETASRIVEKYGESVTSNAVLRYAGKAYLNKEAAVQSLANRYHGSKNPEFVKIARTIVQEVKEEDFDKISSICKQVTLLDKSAGFDILGFNFYKEALVTKSAALSSVLNVNLAGKEVPWEKIQRFGKDRIGSTLGQDIAKELVGDPVSDRAVLESLPRDLQLTLYSLVKG